MVAFSILSNRKVLRMRLEFSLKEYTSDKENRVVKVFLNIHFPLESLSGERCFSGPQAFGGVRMD